MDVTNNTRVAQMVSSERTIANCEVGRFKSSPAYQIRWAEELTCLTGVYVRRWYIETPFFSLRLHHWLHSDDARYLHDHPWWFLTFVLSGRYTDISSSGQEHLQTRSIRYRPSHHSHSVKVDKGGAWTFLITGPKVRKWGFWVGKKWKKSNKYFLENGKHVCD